MSLPPMTPPAIPNRPLGAADILQAMFALYKRGWKTLVLLSLLPSILSVAVLLGALIGMFLPILPLLLQGANGIDSETAILSAFGSVTVLLVALLLGELLLVALGCWIGAAVGAAVHTMDEGHLPTMREIWQRCRVIIGQCFALVGLYAAGGLAVMLLLAALIALPVALKQPELKLLIFPAMLALAVAVIVLNARLALTLPILGIEQRTAMEAVGRSWQLTRGATLRVIGVQLLVGLLISLGQQLILGILQLCLRSVIEQLEYAGSDPVGLLIVGGPALIIGLFTGTAYRILTTPANWLINSVLYIDLTRRRAHGMV